MRPQVMNIVKAMWAADTESSSFRVADFVIVRPAAALMRVRGCTASWVGSDTLCISSPVLLL